MDHKGKASNTTLWISSIRGGPPPPFPLSCKDKLLGKYGVTKLLGTSPTPLQKKSSQASLTVRVLRYEIEKGLRAV